MERLFLCSSRSLTLAWVGPFWVLRRRPSHGPELGMACFLSYLRVGVTGDLMVERCCIVYIEQPPAGLAGLSVSTLRIPYMEQLLIAEKEPTEKRVLPGPEVWRMRRRKCGQWCAARGRETRCAGSVGNVGPQSQTTTVSTTNHQDYGRISAVLHGGHPCG